MPWFIVVVGGGPLQMTVEKPLSDTTEAWAFYTTRCVNADNERAAESRAIDAALEELRANRSIKLEAAAMRFEVDQIHKATWLDRIRRSYHGFTFFPFRKEDWAAVN